MLVSEEFSCCIFPFIYVFHSIFFLIILRPLSSLVWCQFNFSTFLIPNPFHLIIVTQQKKEEKKLSNFFFLLREIFRSRLKKKKRKILSKKFLTHEKNRALALIKD
jgi:hypothetical protein